MPKLTKLSKVQKVESSHPSSPSRATNTFSNEKLPKRNFQFLSKLYSSSHFDWKSYQIAKDNFQLKNKLGCQHSKYLRKVKIFPNCQADLRTFFRIFYSLFKSKSRDIRSIEILEFPWRTFKYQRIYAIWDAFMTRWKRLQVLHINFTVIPFVFENIVSYD